MQKASLLLMLITVGTKFFGLAREKALAHFFGTSAVANIFLIAFTLPMVVSNLFSGAISGGFIPVYTEILNDEGKERADSFTSKLMLLVALVAFVISLLTILFAPTLVRLMASGFSGTVFTSTVYMTRITAASIMTTAVFSIFKAYLQIEEHFVVSMFHSVVMNTILIVAMFLGRTGNLSLLAFGILFAFIFQYIIFFPYIKKTGFRFRLDGYKETKGLGQLMILILPILISTSVLEINNIISKSLASNIDLTGVAVINYATKIQGFVTGIVVTSIVTVTYPKMAKLVESKTKDALRDVFSKGLSLMAIFIVPASVGVVCFHREIVRLLFLSGAFSQEDVLITADVLLVYALGLFAIGIREIGIRIFYSKKDPKVPVINSVYMVLFNIILSIFLARVFGLVGLAMGTTIALWIGAVGMLIHLKHYIGGLGLQKRGKNFLKIFVASLAMGVGVKLAEGFFMGYFSVNVSLVFAIFIGAGIYFVLAALMRFEEFEQIFAVIKNIKNKVMDR